MKALVVDDSMLARKMLLNTLKKGGIDDADQAADGAEAVSMIAQQNYDIVFLDWNMPKMLGIDAVRKIRSMNQRILIVMVTGLADEMHIREAIQAGINNYIVKPFDEKSMIEIVHHMRNMSEAIAS